MLHTIITVRLAGLVIVHQLLEEVTREVGEPIGICQLAGHRSCHFSLGEWHNLRGELRRLEFQKCGTLVWRTVAVVLCFLVCQYLRADHDLARSCKAQASRIGAVAILASNDAEEVLQGVL